MSDSYTQFSFMVHRLTKAEVAWLKKILTILLEVGPGTDIEELKEMLGKAADSVTGLEYWPDINYKFEKSNSVLKSVDSIWFYSDSCCNTDHVAALLQAFLAKFRRYEVISFESSFSCSKPMLGAFGGVAYTVTAEQILAVSTSQLTQLFEKYLHSRFIGPEPVVYVSAGQVLEVRPENKTTQYTNLVISEKAAKEARKLLKRKTKVPGKKEDILAVYTAVFGGDVEIDLKIVNSSAGPYLDLVLVKAGKQIDYRNQECKDILGTFSIDLHETTYTVYVTSEKHR